MVAKSRAVYQCTQCGAEASQWSGKCFACGEWSTLELQAEVALPQTSGGRGASSNKPKVLEPMQMTAAAQQDVLRLKTGMKDVDALLGGGVVPGAVQLLAGQPGIGKSTILLQIAHALAAKHRVLYVSGEESAQQVGLRARRLKLTAHPSELVSSTSADDIAATIMSTRPDVVIVDSVQTIATSAVGSAAGSVSQITNSTHLLTKAAKQSSSALFLVGHVTKEGSIAGPKVLEHLVDVVLQFEGDRYGGFKILRAVKNRYGSTEHSALFEMKDMGLVPVANPSAALLAERMRSDGSVVCATMEGTRPLLVEIQALVNTTNYGYPKRAASGIDANRLNVLIAMLEKRTKLTLGDKDIYVNVVGGIKIQERAADLAVCMAIASATRGMELKKDAVVFGEVGLSGEVRHVSHVEKRIAEAKKLGFEAAIGPAQAKKMSHYEGVADVRVALNRYLSK